MFQFPEVSQTPPSKEYPKGKPGDDYVRHLPESPAKTDQIDRERERKKRIKPVLYPSKDSPDRGLSYYEVYPISQLDQIPGQNETVSQVFPLVHAMQIRGEADKFFAVDKRPSQPRFRKHLDYGKPKKFPWKLHDTTTD